MFKLLLLLKTNIPSDGKPLAAVKHLQKKPLSLKLDTTAVGVKHFNADAIKAYNNNTDFNYSTVTRGITWWDRFWNWIWYIWESFLNWIARMIEKLLGHGAIGHNPATTVKYVIMGLAACLIVYIVFKLIGMDLPHLFKKQSKQVPMPYSELTEDIHEINFDTAIEDALALKNYRLAVRLLYLRSLKLLNDRNLINWKIEKTNTAYINELSDTEQRRQFTLVTRQFEYVWYGNFPVDGQSFQRISDIFQEFKQQLT